MKKKITISAILSSENNTGTYLLRKENVIIRQKEDVTKTTFLLKKEFRTISSEKNIVNIKNNKVLGLVHVHNILSYLNS